jgi:MATE family multidrug resistance protein
MLARVGQLALVTVDTVMTGRYAADALAAYALAQAVFMTLMLLGMGLVTGTVVLVAQADGAGRKAECGTIWRTALADSLFLGAFGALLLLPGRTIFLTLGQDPELAAAAGATLRMLAIGLPGLLAFQVTSFLLEGIRRPQLPLLVMVGGNLANLLLNAVLIEGRFGLPAMGAEGAALATSLVRIGMAAALALAALRLPVARSYGLVGPSVPVPRLRRRLLALGVPVAASQGLESTAFNLLIVMAGWLGATALASFQILLNLTALVYMLTIGVATATAVRVGGAVGRGVLGEAARAAGTGLGAGLLATGIAGLFLLLLRPQLLAAYTADPAVLALAAPVVLLLPPALLLDCAQGVLGGALRGGSDVRVPTLLYLVAFWGVQLPAAYLAAIVFGLGVAGLVLGILVGCAAATLLLGGRLLLLLRAGRLVPA